MYLLIRYRKTHFKAPFLFCSCGQYYNQVVFTIIVPGRRNKTLSMPRLPGQTESTLENRGKIRSMWENDVFKAAIAYMINSSTFCSSEDNLKVLWRLDNTRYDPRHVQPTRRSRRITCGYWGWMSSHGPGELVSVSQLFSSEEYVVILEDVLPPTVNVVYIQKGLF
ncbi:hypothetical protein ILUMI_04712 [Ignelater luminosus]|uniref:Uncharacterized protein n=1 Tax=Ignelater luminosus TaxID=2038154 RepID=A0A8K0DC01_IGNLU|nr:hypothetical protein ILUMI_04712 [Ignelater luminosus]